MSIGSLLLQDNPFCLFDSSRISAGPSWRRAWCLFPPGEAPCV